MWHSHGYEVSSGQLIAPGIPAHVEHALMERLAHTYGKTWHIWHTDQDKALPMGMPQLMMGFTADGQADPAMVEHRNQRLGVDAAKTKAERVDIRIPDADPKADGWQHGNVIQITDPTGAHVHRPSTATPSTTNSRSSQQPCISFEWMGPWAGPPSEERLSCTAPWRCQGHGPTRASILTPPPLHGLRAPLAGSSRNGLHRATSGL